MALGTLFRTPRPPSSPGGSDDAADEVLLARFARKGDQQAFASLVRRHGPQVYGVCRRILRDDHAAEDAFQSTFLLLAKKAPTIARPEALGGWLFGVAVRVATKTRATTVAGAPLPDAPAPITDPTADLAGEELRLALDEELAQLADDDRDLLVLIYLEGKTHDAAARAVGCPLGSVAWRLTRARENLRKRLHRRGVALSVGLLLLLASMGRAQSVTESCVRRTVVAAAGKKATAAGGAVAAAHFSVPLGCLLGVLLFATTALAAWAVVARHPGSPGSVKKQSSEPGTPHHCARD